MIVIKRVYAYLSIITALILSLNSSPAKAMPPLNYHGYTEIDNSHFKKDTLLSGTYAKSRNNIISLDLLVMFPALGYSRVVPLSNKTGLVFSGSITPFFDGLIDLGGAVTLGKNHHYFEPGGGYQIVNNNFFKNNFYIKAGYRYQSNRGFVFRIAPAYIITVKVPWLTMSLGYAF